MDLASPAWALMVSFLACWAILATRRAHAAISLDATIPGLQKIHKAPVPRVGGLAILAGVGFGALIMRNEYAQPLGLYLLAALPAFSGGFLEDVTKRVTPYSRLLFAFGAAAVGYVLLDGRITGLDLPGDDLLFRYEVFAFGFTLFAVGGFAHATNIIDGMNGLSGLVSVAILAALAYVAWEVGDTEILQAALLVMAATLGFLAWNFPRGLIFAGDGGAYFLGFAIAELAVLLVHHNSEVSPWFALLALWYPVWETLFSGYRRSAIRGRSMAEPDGLHLHTLVYRRIARFPRRPTLRNAASSFFMLVLTLATVVPAALFWDSTAILQAFAAAFAAAYVWLYCRIVRFRVPRGLLPARALRGPVENR